MSESASAFASLEQMDIHFKKRLRKAPNHEAEAEIRAEWSRTRAVFWAQRVAREAEAAKNEADEVEAARQQYGQPAGAITHLGGVAASFPTPIQTRPLQVEITEEGNR